MTDKFDADINRNLLLGDHLLDGLCLRIARAESVFRLDAEFDGLVDGFLSFVDHKDTTRTKMKGKLQSIQSQPSQTKDRHRLSFL
jgi:hypothetical protein